jgi:hypothetical protein
MLHAASAESWIEGMEFSSIQTRILPSSGLVGAMGRISINQTPRVDVNHGFARKDRSGYINDPSAGSPTDPDDSFTSVFFSSHLTARTTGGKLEPLYESPLHPDWHT